MQVEIANLKNSFQREISQKEESFEEQRKVMLKKQKDLEIELDEDKSIKAAILTSKRKLELEVDDLSVRLDMAEKVKCYLDYWNLLIDDASGQRRLFTAAKEVPECRRRNAARTTRSRF